MNAYFIDFMIREKQQLELEEAKRARMQRNARQPASESPFLAGLCALTDCALSRKRNPESQIRPGTGEADVSNPERVSK